MTAATDARLTVPSPDGEYRYIMCDVFTDRPLQGNQLAVFPDASTIPSHLLQPLAREIGFSETVFVYPPDGDETARIRIFTTAVELPFAGHPVLGTAVVLGAEERLREVHLGTGRGVIAVALDWDARGAPFGWMEQPLPLVSAVNDDRSLLSALGLHRSELPVERYDNGVGHVYVALPDEEAVAALTPDMTALARVGRETPGGIVGVNCFAGAGRRWKTRMFAPVEGFEDPATGSAAGPLAVHLVRHGLVPAGETIEISQGDEIGRPSTLRARIGADGADVRLVEVGGQAVIVGYGAFQAAVFATLATAVDVRP